MSCSGKCFYPGKFVTAGHSTISLAETLEGRGLAMKGASRDALHDNQVLLAPRAGRIDHILC